MGDPVQAATAPKVVAGRFDGFDGLSMHIDRMASETQLLVEDLSRALTGRYGRHRRDLENIETSGLMGKIAVAIVHGMSEEDANATLALWDRRLNFWQRFKKVVRCLPEEVQRWLAERQFLGDKFALSDEELDIGFILGHIERLLVASGDKPMRKLVRGAVSPLGIPGHAMILWIDMAGRLQVDVEKRRLPAA